MIPTHTCCPCSVLLNRELHKADLQIGRLRAEIKELEAKLRQPRFSPG